MPRSDEPSPTTSPERPAGRQIDLGTAQLAQFGAAALVVVGIACFVMAQKDVWPWWLALLLGIPITAAGAVLLWKAYGWETSAVQLTKANKPSAEPTDRDPTAS